MRARRTLRRSSSAAEGGEAAWQARGLGDAAGASAPSFNSQELDAFFRPDLLLLALSVPYYPLRPFAAHDDREAANLEQERQRALVLCYRQTAEERPRDNAAARATQI